MTDVQSPGIQAFKLEDDGNSFVLDHHYFSALVICQATVEDWCSKLKSGAYTGPVDSDELVSSSTKRFEPN